MATATTANSTDKKTRAKKGDGPVSFKFINDKNEASKRIPDNIDALQVINKAGKSKNLSISGLPVQVIRQLAASAFKVKLNSFAIASVKTNPNADVLGLADELYNNVKSGKLYVRGEGAKSPGRTFDFDLWVSAMIRMSQITAEKNPKVKPFSKKQEADLRARLEAATPADRKVMTTKWMTNPIVKRAVMEIKAERAKNAVSSTDYENFDNLF